MGVALLEQRGEKHQVLTAGPEERLASAMGLVNAASAELVAAIAAALASGGWRGDGITTAEHWVALRCGVANSRARRLVSLARGLAELPVAAGAFGDGALSEDQVSLLCAHVDAAHDQEVTGLARRCTIPQLRRILPSVIAPDPEPEPSAGEEGDAHSGMGDTPGRRDTAFGNHEDGRWWAR
ncbi:MAG: DUF222 domain-containing protein, partial [Acidimicrobiales bacterium]